jgi:hypothetical protein
MAAEADGSSPRRAKPLCSTSATVVPETPPEAVAALVETLEIRRA